MTSSVLEEGLRRRLSLAVSVAVFGAISALGVLQLLEDGSFWIDEASVALSLLELPPLERLGPLVGGQSFPRLYLLAISGLVEAFGYETWVTRALPHLCFQLASLAWVRLLYLRFRDEPLLVALGGLLLVIPATWFVHAALFKAYTLDVLLASLPFLLRDDFYDRTLGRGESPVRLFALTAPGALSYPFAMALLARCGGWWLARASEGRGRVSARGLGVGLAGVALFAAAVWTTDLRHTQVLGDALRSFWSRCLVGAGDTGTPALLHRFAFGWYDGRADFSHGGGLDPLSLWIVEAGFALGLVALVASLFPRLRAPGSEWGSRSLGCGVLIAGLPLASWLVGYPICAGRLTLFALLPLVLVTLEGAALAAAGLRRLPWGGFLAVGIGCALVAWIAPTSARDALARARAPAPQDLRPLLAKVRRQPALPILSNTCTRKQIETLPEGAPAPVYYVEEGGVIAVAAPEPHAAWFLYVPEPYCRRAVRKVIDGAERSTPHHAPEDEARLFELRFPKPGP